MKSTPNEGFAERLKTAAVARQALLSNFKPQQARPALQRIDRAGDHRAALVQVRVDRAGAKAAKQQAAAAIVAAAAQLQADAEMVELTAKRGERKERKALSAIEAKAKRDARYAARQSRR